MLGPAFILQQSMWAEWGADIPENTWGKRSVEREATSDSELNWWLKVCSKLTFRWFNDILT